MKLVMERASECWDAVSRGLFASRSRGAFDRRDLLLKILIVLAMYSWALPRSRNPSREEAGLGLCVKEHR